MYLMYKYFIYSELRCYYVAMYILSQSLPDQDCLASFLDLLLCLPCVSDCGQLLLARARDWLVSWSGWSYYCSGMDVLDTFYRSIFKQKKELILSPKIWEKAVIAKCNH